MAAMRSLIHLRAYHRADYYVRTPYGRRVLRIGVASPALRRLHRQLGVDESALLTACNPRSRRAGPGANRAANARLWRRLRELGFAPWPSWGRDPAGIWPA